MQRYAIIGHPVAHSLSPLLHNAAFDALGLDGRYEAIDIEDQDLAGKIRELRDEGLAGFNVTVPHKEAILPLLNTVDEDARQIGAVNTVSIRGGKLTGWNTDAYGFSRLSEPYISAIKGSHVAVLGAGGSARAVLFALTTGQEAGRITVFNRTLERAEELAGAFATPAIPIVPQSLFQEGLQHLMDEIQVIINTTSVGLKPYTDATPLEDVKLRKHQLVIDLVYSPPETKLLKEAKAAGATAINGWEMLLHQASGAFKIWTGKDMPLESVRKAVSPTDQQ